ncbi:MAG TPA: methyltransferase domain-containing protein [Acidimicrobiales bacterium]|nr:methyltransferase domain-containing protein [Acidimicrobiales bacterium]
MAADTPDPALDDLLRRVNEIVDHSPADRRDEELLAVFRDLRAPVRGPVGDLRARIEALPASVVDHGPVPTSSRLPGGSLVHRALNKATARRDQLLLQDIRALAGEVRDRLLELSALGPAGSGALERLGERMEALADLLADVQARHSVAEGRIEAIEQRLAALEADSSDRDYHPWFSSMEFDDEFRGGRNVILDRYHDIADILAATGGPVADLGCGRGELVELLVTRGIDTWGVEMSPELVEYCRSIYLDVRLNDAASALHELDDAELGGAALIHVVEHVTPQQLADLVALLVKKVRPGGVVVAETPNTTSPYIFSHSFYLDPTHRTPVHPSYLEFLFRKAGFSDVRILWRSEVSDSDRLVPVDAKPEQAELAAQINEGFELLDRLLLGPQDYAVIAVR